MEKLPIYTQIMTDSLAVKMTKFNCDTERPICNPSMFYCTDLEHVVFNSCLRNSITLWKFFF